MMTSRKVSYRPVSLVRYTNQMLGIIGRKQTLHQSEILNDLLGRYDYVDMKLFN